MAGKKRKVTYVFGRTDLSKNSVSFEVIDGESPYERWLDLPGNAGKTIEQYFAETANSPKGDEISEISCKEEIIES